MRFHGLQPRRRRRRRRQVVWLSRLCSHIQLHGGFMAASWWLHSPQPRQRRWRRRQVAWLSRLCSHMRLHGGFMAASWRLHGGFMALLFGLVFVVAGPGVPLGWSALVANPNLRNLVDPAAPPPWWTQLPSRPVGHVDLPVLVDPAALVDPHARTPVTVWFNPSLLSPLGSSPRLFFSRRFNRCVAPWWRRRTGQPDCPVSPLFNVPTLYSLPTFSLRTPPTFPPLLGPSPLLAVFKLAASFSFPIPFAPLGAFH